jgi:signal transduction histidine kinase
VLVPLIAGVALASARVVSENATIRSVNDLNGQAHVALTLSGLVYAVQDERDTVQVYLTDGEQTSDMTTLSRVEATTQSEIADFDAARQTYGTALGALAPSVQTLMQQGIARLGDLPTLRVSVTTLGVSRPIYQAYTTIIGDLLNFSDQLSTDTTDHDLASYVSTLGLVQQAGEQSSQERGYLVGILGDGGQLLSQQEDLIQAQAQYNTTLSTIDAQSPTSIVDLFQADVGGDVSGSADSTVQQTVDTALQDTPVSGVGVTDTAAYSEMTTKIGQIRSIQNDVGQDILQRTSALLSSAQDDLYLNVGIIVAVLLLAALATILIARSISRPLQVLRTSALDIAEVRLPAIIERLRDPAQAGTVIEVEPIAIDSRDEIGAVARAFDAVNHSAVRLASEQALLRSSVNAVFTNLSRRSQTLVERQLQLIDDLEGGEREPGRLAQLFRLDHLATRMRRNNENLLVLAGEETARRWTDAVRLVDVARAAAAEVEHYERIILGEVPRVGIVGQVAPDVAHLIAELLENATAFSAPKTKVWIAARAAENGGVVVRIEDAGIGMKRAELDEANERISNPPVVDVSVARRMGLYVVGRLAARYGIEVRLGESQVGGVAALIHLPARLLADTGGQPLPGSTQVDEEFYALSRQFSRAANQGSTSGAGAPAAALLGETPTGTGPMAGWQPDSQEPPARPEPAPWYNQQRVPHQSGPVDEPVGETWFVPSEDRKGELDEEQSPAALLPPAPDGGPRKDPFREYGGLGQSIAGSRDQAPPQQAPQAPQVPQPRLADAFGARLQPRNRASQPPVPPQRHARPEAGPAPAAPVEAQPLEPTPIFEAIESEWFRRREQARAAGRANRPAGAAARDADPSYIVDAPAASQGMGVSPDQTGQLPVQAASAPTAVASAPEPEAPEPAPASDWSSPADSGWRAAQALANPAHEGQTTAGLPRRTPRANLVPGRAGGTGAARAVPPPRFRQDPSAGGQS